MKKAAVLLSPAVLLAAAFFAFPLELMTLWRKAALKAHGARRVKLGTLAAYERDSCPKGRPCKCVALLHGLGDTSLTWDKLLKAAPEATLVVAPDLPGTEGSEPPPSWGVRAQAKVMRTALEGRCAKWTVAGNSLGGWIAAWLALDWPQGVEELVLLDAAGVDDPTGTAVETAMFLANPTAEGLRAFDPKARHEPRAVPDRILRQVAEQIRSRNTAKIVAALSRDELLEKRLKDLKIPALIIWGMSDRLTPPEMGRRFQSLIKGSRLVLLEKCGHLPQQECPEKTLTALGW